MVSLLFKKPLRDLKGIRVIFKHVFLQTKRKILNQEVKIYHVKKKIILKIARPF